MINRVLRLTAPKQFSTELCRLDLKGLIVRPDYLSICAADQRYYNGLRPGEILSRKLPMALLHEGCASVVFDESGEYQAGSRVLLVPNIPPEHCDGVRANYSESSRFCSSDCDGFSREYISLRRDCAVPFREIEPQLAALCELFSVACHSVRPLIEASKQSSAEIAVFGDGSAGYVCALALKALAPKLRVCVFGHSDEKLSFFSFADAVYRAGSPDTLPRFDHAVECVGGVRSSAAINEIIRRIRPQGSIVLMGVSEEAVPVFTRLVLEKGLTLIGRSRSTAQDFRDCVKLLEAKPSLRRELAKIIRSVKTVRSASELCAAFDEDWASPFKTVLDWRL